MANIMYDSFFTDLMDGEIDLKDGTYPIKMALLNNHSPSAGHSTFNDVKDDEAVLDPAGNLPEGEDPETEPAKPAAPSGYTAGGVVLTGIELTNKTFKANSPTWTIEDATLTATHGVIYQDTENAETSQLICCLDFGGAKVVVSENTRPSSTPANFTVNLHASGVFSFSA